MTRRLQSGQFGGITNNRPDQRHDKPDDRHHTTDIEQLNAAKCAEADMRIPAQSNRANREDDAQLGWTETGNIITPIPTSCAWLLPLNDATDGISVGFLIGIAATCDFATMVTTAAGEATSS